MSDVVLFTDDEASFRVPARGTVDVMFKKHLMQELPMVSEGKYYSYSDLIEVWGQSLGRILYTALRMDFPRAGYALTTTSPHIGYRKSIVYAVGNIEEAAHKRIHGPKINATSKKNFLKIQKIFLAPHEVGPKKFS